MNWVQTYSHNKSLAEARAKGRAELKPRHFRKLKSIWADKYLKKRNYSLTANFEVCYALNMAQLYSQENSLVSLVKNNHSFYGSPVKLGYE